MLGYGHRKLRVIGSIRCFIVLDEIEAKEEVSPVID
jgi:hypothetical protein